MPENANFKYDLVYKDPDGNPLTLKPRIISIPYKIHIAGALPIPAGMQSGTEIDLPFTGLTHTTMRYIENLTGQELNMAWQGNWMPHLPVNGVHIIAHPSYALAGDVTAYRFFLTQDQAADGLVNYVILGS